MVKILSWNTRGLGLPNKRRALKDFLYYNHIDIVGIQETKKEHFHSRTLNALSHIISHWIYKPSQGSAGGILLGINDTKFWILNTWILNYSITVHLKIGRAHV